MIYLGRSEGVVRNNALLPDPLKTRVDSGYSLSVCLLPKGPFGHQPSAVVFLSAWIYRFTLTVGKTRV